jgi:hypothetical protein
LSTILHSTVDGHDDSIPYTASFTFTKKKSIIHVRERLARFRRKDIYRRRFGSSGERVVRETAGGGDEEADWRRGVCLCVWRG